MIASENRNAIMHAANKAFSMLRTNDTTIVVPHTGEMMPKYVFDSLEKKFKDSDLFPKLFLDFFWRDVFPRDLKSIAPANALTI